MRAAALSLPGQAEAYDHPRCHHETIELLCVGIAVNTNQKVNLATPLTWVGGHPDIQSTLTLENYRPPMVG